MNTVTIPIATAVLTRSQKWQEYLDGGSFTFKGRICECGFGVNGNSIGIHLAFLKGVHGSQEMVSVDLPGCTPKQHCDRSTIVLLYFSHKPHI